MQPAENAPADVGEIEEPRLADLYVYWAAKRPAAGGRPPRGAIDPVDIPKILPFLMLVEIHGPERFFFRLVGTNVAQGIDPTGRYLAEGAPDGPYRAHIVALFGECQRRGGPVYAISLYDGPSGPQRRTHRLFLPVEPRPGDPPLMLVGQVTESEKSHNGSLWQVAPQMIATPVLKSLDSGGRR
ncbi:MAG: PAS domain-containing protein [Alphaproteobacteria bacterium]|nr:PAS domain-containing protein [Alphaproteobacteria bacterium]